LIFELKMRKPLTFFCLALLLIAGFSHLSFGLVSVKDISIEGEYLNHKFTGFIVFTFSQVDEKELYFHLPSSWYAKSDRRESYQFQDENRDRNNIARKELKVLREYTHQNIHLPKGISIKSVLINGSPVPFRVINNKVIKPRCYSENNLLKVELKEKRNLSKVMIEFTTLLNELPGGIKMILWDFAPRFVSFVNHQWDFEDRWKVNRSYKFKIGLGSSDALSGKRLLQQPENMSIPVLLIDPWTSLNPVYKLSTSDYFDDQLPFVQSVLNRPLKFLLKNQWIKDNHLPFKFFIWDGVTTVSGRTILLPEKLFKYSSIFNKKMEIEVLKGVVQFGLNQNYIFDFQNHLWMLPALQSIPIHSYINKQYSGNSRFFPWPNWLNPDFFQENSIKPWLYQSKSKILIAATKSRDHTYYSHIYHPWKEKGFHLLPLLFEGEKEFEPKIKALIINEQAKQILLTRELFFSILNIDQDQRAVGLKWLSSNETIDYGIEDIVITPSSAGTNIEIEITNTGSLSPVFEIELIDGNGNKERFWLAKGASLYRLSSSINPVQIVVDPDYLLLETNILNNSWSLPLKIRPFWDFSPANQWLFTVSPIIGGNVFDRNMIGLDFTLNYLNQTTVNLYAWKNDENDEILMEGSFEQKYFPWENANVSFIKSQLNATNASTLSFTHHFKDIDNEAWINLDLSQEKYDDIQSESEFDEPNQWDVVKLVTEFPLLEGNFSQWKTYFSANQGQKEDRTDLNFQQQSFSQKLVYFFTESNLHLQINNDYSSGIVPLQKKYSIGGPEALPGFPRETELLYYQRDIVEVGAQFPPFLTHSKLNFGNILWLNRIAPTINFHWGAGHREENQKTDIYRDVELRFSIYGEFINLYEGFVDLAIAQPIGHEKYKNYRFIAFSTWVF